MVSGRLVTKIAHLGKSLPTQAARFEEGTMKLMGGRRALPQAVFVAYRLIARSVTSGMGGCPTALLRLNLQKEQHVCDLPFQAPPKRRRTAGGLVHWGFQARIPNIIGLTLSRITLLLNPRTAGFLFILLVLTLLPLDRDACVALLMHAAAVSLAFLALINLRNATSGKPT